MPVDDRGTGEQLRRSGRLSWLVRVPVPERAAAPGGWHDALRVRRAADPARPGHPPRRAGLEVLPVQWAGRPGGEHRRLARRSCAGTWRPPPRCPEVLHERAMERLESTLVDGAVVIVASEYRAQLANRRAAEARLVALLTQAIAAPPAPRRPTRPSLARCVAGWRARSTAPSSSRTAAAPTTEAAGVAAAGTVSRAGPAGSRCGTARSARGSAGRLPRCAGCRSRPAGRRR